MRSPNETFDLTGRVAIITGGAGLLGRRHAEAIAGAGGIPVLVDLPVAEPQQKAAQLIAAGAADAMGAAADITRLDQVQALRDAVLRRYGRVDILINNAANNPKVEAAAGSSWTRVENFPMEVWDADLAVGLTGAFLCARVFGSEMAASRRGVIVNVASDLGVIAPDQRIYRKEGLAEQEQMVKPVTYSIVKTALIGLTRYLATYWADAGVRVNAVSPGGVFNGQPDEFVQKLAKLIPLGRMANLEEYQGVILFLCSDASSYMTGANISIDGGRTCW